jgi:hypothetical protein
MCALLFAFVTVSSACMAAPADWSVERAAQRDGGEIHGGLRDESRGRGENRWSNGFKPSELIGLNVAGFYSAGSLS